MKLQCHRPSLAAAFQVVSGVVPTRTPKEILKNVKLEVVGGAAVLIGTDQEIGIRYEVPGVEIEGEGTTLLPTNRLLSILRELTDEKVYLEATDEAVWVRAGHSEFRLSAGDPAEFPTVTPFADERYHAISGPVLREAIRRTVFATDVESTRYALGGVLLELKADSMTLAATDSRRLSVVQSSCRSEGVDQPENASPVIPAKAMSLVERTLVGDEDEEVFLAVHANDVLIKSGNSTIASRLVEGRFPRYREVIPKEAKSSVELIVGPFFSAVRQAQIVTNEESRGVDFQFADGLLTLKSQATDVGQSKVELPIDYSGDEITITFDPRFIADFLRVLQPESQVRLDLIDAESAAVFRTEGSYTYVVMPLSRDRA